MMSNDPLMVSGTTGSCNSSAKVNAPFLKMPMWPVKERDPSGKTTTLMPLCNVWRASSYVSFMRAGLRLSTNM